jgi:hypothetical protein
MQGYHHGVAIQMLMASWNNGKYAEYSQFGSIRGLQMAILCLRSCWHVAYLPTESEWFGNFVRGYKLRMGQILKSDLAVIRHGFAIHDEQGGGSCSKVS